MALLKTWIAEISTNPSLVTRAVEEGLHHMGYERLKPELRGVLTLASARFVLQAGTEELLNKLFPGASKELFLFCGFEYAASARHTHDLGTQSRR